MLSKKKIKGKNKGERPTKYARETQGRIKPLLLENCLSWPRAVLHHLLSVLRSHSASACLVQQTNKALGKGNITQIILLISGRFVKNLQASVLVYIHQSQINKNKLSMEQHPTAESGKDRDFGLEGRWQDKPKATERDTEKNEHGH